ncbi:MAG TPA: alpha/beta hydrolase [Candidatus Sulfomarinibacteraceae bacterium]|nr:alpha/beta hydrolase [Candidatus Sulfomarinibacteraceae bacterium]
MSSIVTEQGILHYETIGRGRPIILLHGWINSWDVWREAMIALGSSGEYRVYALDFWGFGDSSKRDGASNESSFRIASYVEMVRQFMDRLGIVEAPVFGHSMGGTVALQMALRNPQRIRKVAVVGSPVVGASLNPFLKLAGYGAIAELVWRFPAVLNLVMHIILARDSRKVQEMIFRDVQRTTLESFFRSIGDLRDTDLRPELPALDIPVLGIYGANDNIVSPTNARLLADAVDSSHVTMMRHSRHFPMSDEPDKFLTVMTRFLSNNDPNGAGAKATASLE